MLANALMAATAILVAVGLFVLGQLRFLVPWRDFIVHHYGWDIGLFCGLLWLNLTAAIVFIQRTFFLKDAGRKLAHFDKQIHTGRHALSAEIIAIDQEE
jgi:hypothetical protein